MRGVIYLLLVLLAVSSCGSDAPQESSVQNKSRQSDVVRSADTVLAISFYKRLEGTIADAPVIMHLHSTNNKLEGVYYYLQSGIPIYISGSVDSVGMAKVYMTEPNREDGTELAKINLAYGDGTFKGEWLGEKDNKKFDVLLREYYPEGSYSFNTMNVSGAIPAFLNEKESPYGKISFALIVPNHNDSGKSWLSAQIKEIIGLSKEEQKGNIHPGIVKNINQYLKNYKKDIAQFGSKDRGAFMNYDAQTNLSVLYNNNDILVLNCFVYAYTGGAHGNGGSTFYCLDLAGNKRLQLSDVIDTDSTTLQRLLEQNFRKQNGLSAADSLNKILFENHLATTRNFYITPKGLGFYYFPYEVAAYANGPIEVFISFEELKPYLTTFFKNRMKL